MDSAAQTSLILSAPIVVSKMRVRDPKKQKQYSKNHRNNPLYREIVLEKKRVWSRAKQRKLKEDALSFYGKLCACCGESRYYFLCIDHIDGGGAKHIKSISGNNLYRWLKVNHYPSGFQTLCFNCNFAKRDKKVCPCFEERVDRAA